jgi:hypothetical protein
MATIHNRSGIALSPYNIVLQCYYLLWLVVVYQLTSDLKTGGLAR